MSVRIVEIKPKYADYVSNIISIRWEIYKGEYAHIVPCYLSKKKESKCFVAVENGKPIGMGAFHINNDVEVDLHPWCAGLWVEPEKRGNGIGHRFTLKRFAWARKLGYKVIYLDTVDAEEYHLKFGWRYTGIIGLFHGEPTTIMEHDL